mgnify:CR=1 FL=1
MSDCSKFKGRLIDMYYGELRGRALEQTQEHLEACADCREEFEGMETFGTMVSQFDVPPCNEDGVAAIMEAVSRDQPLRHRIWAVLKTNLEPVERIFLPGVLSILTCALTLAPIVMGPGVKTIPPMALLVCGVLWSSIYNSIIGAVLEGSRHRDGHIRLRVVLYGVLVSMLFMHFFYFAGLKFALLPANLAATFLLRLSGCLTMCSALALLVVGMGIGLFVKRRSFPHLLLVLTLYLSINLPGLSVFTRMQVSLSSLLNLAMPVILAAILGLGLGHLLQEAYENYQKSHRREPLRRQTLANVAGD